MYQPIFSDKSKQPKEKDLVLVLGETYALWQKIKSTVYAKYPEGIEQWNFPGKKYGWSFRIKDKKRAIIYFIPLDGFFKVAFVFGQKATDAIMESSISQHLKKDLQNAKVYAEGRGIRIDILDDVIFPDIQKLIDYKLAY